MSLCNFVEDAEKTSKSDHCIKNNIPSIVMQDSHTLNDHEKVNIVRLLDVSCAIFQILGKTNYHAI